MPKIKTASYKLIGNNTVSICNLNFDLLTYFNLQSIVTHKFFAHKVV